MSRLHAVTLAFCQKKKEEDESWTWTDSFPNLSKTFDDLDQPFIKEIIPNTLKLLQDRVPTFKGSQSERELVEYSQVDTICKFYIQIIDNKFTELEYIGS